MDALKVYKKLLAYFGPQGWWPIFDKKSQKCCYSATIGNQVPASKKFEICVGAILTQNTAWKNVEKALANLSLRAPYSGRGNPINPKMILSCKNLETLIQPAGYYNQKAKKLRIFADWWLSCCHCEESAMKQSRRPSVIPHLMRDPGIATPLEGLAMTEMRCDILSLWGIGPETADSILLYAFNQPIFVIDAYTKRLCKEFDIEFKTYDEYRQFFESQLSNSAKLFNEYHALIVAWGKLHSKDKELAVNILTD
ncbi:MAG: hypothetical protein V1661_00530 [bacterium]